MSKRLFFQPPEIVETEGPIIFLAGPIQGAADWQSVAIAEIHNLDPSIVVASPRKNYPEGTFVYEKQVDWETHFLRLAGKAGVIGFWLAAQSEETPGRAYAQTSRFELGEWKDKNTKLTLGIEEGFGNAHYIVRRFAQDRPDVKVARTLLAMCRNAVDLIHEIE